MIKNVKEILSLKNPWWQSKIALPDVPKKERDIVKMMETPNENSALLLIGPRQSGKTTAMLQTIRFLLKNNHSTPYNVVYAPMDVLKDTSIIDIITLHQEMTGKTKKIYYFFDEIHYDKDWSIHLKTLIDNKTQNYFYATGSSSTLLLKDTAESGLGRFNFLSMYPLSFKEYASFKSVFSKIQIDLKKDFESFIKNEALFLSETQKLENLFRIYLLWGGFPSQLSQDFDIDQWHNHLRQNYVSLTIYKDILSRYDVRDPGILEDMLYLVSEKTTLPLSYDAIAKSFNITLETARTYLNYLQAAGLITTCEYFTKNTLKRARRNKKFYVIDPGFNAALSYETMMSDSLLSKNVELTVAIALIRYLRKNTGLLYPRLFYWKNKKECDFILKISQNIIPVEVKYKKEINNNDLQGIIEFLISSKQKKGIIITKNTAEIRKIKNKKIVLIPASIFLSALQ